MNFGLLLRVGSFSRLREKAGDEGAAFTLTPTLSRKRARESA
jgi:hypothetical protein